MNMQPSSVQIPTVKRATKSLLVAYIEYHRNSRWIFLLCLAVLKCHARERRTFY